MWKSIYKELPTNRQIVWIRVLDIYGELAQAEYSVAKQSFTTTLTNIVIPVYNVARWKAIV